MLFGILLGFVLGALLFIGLSSAGRLSAWRSDPEDSRNRFLPPVSATDQPWDRLAMVAGRIVEEAQAELPEDVRAEALQVPTLFEEWHAERPGILGVYYDVHSDPDTRRGPIVLYLRAIESWCRRVRLPFEEQVRATYLHELGHHVGWNEGQVRERGL